MKDAVKVFKVTFKYSDTTYCSNVAIAKDIEDVKEHYKEKEDLYITEGTNYDYDVAVKKQMPIIYCDHIEKPEKPEKPARAKRGERKEAQRMENKEVLQAIEKFNACDDLMENEKRLDYCTAWTYDKGVYKVLRSYGTIIAFIDENGIMYDILRYVYGYTSTSAKHIAKFRRFAGSTKTYKSI